MPEQGVLKRLLSFRKAGPGAGPSPPTGGLEAVYLANREALVRFVRALGAGDQADDIVQELWLRISSAGTMPIGDPLGYLYRSANNLMIDRYRATERSIRRDGEWNSARDNGECSSEAALLAREEIAEVERRLLGLGKRVLRTFVMFRVDGLPQKEIASRLGISLSAVEKDLQQAYRVIAGLRIDSDAG